MTTWAIVATAAAAVLLTITVIVAIRKLRRSRRLTEQMAVRRSLSALPDHSSIEQWRRAARQSQAVSTARRRNGKAKR
jgi:uncharacterized membrane protein YcjF (UPF0283 family)